MSLQQSFQENSSLCFSMLFLFQDNGKQCFAGNKTPLRLIDIWPDQSQLCTKVITSRVHLCPKAVNTILAQISRPKASVNHRMDLRVGEERTASLVGCRGPALNINNDELLAGRLVCKMTECQHQVGHSAFLSHEA